MSDLVKRLRKLAERERPYGSLPDTLDEAAARIERLETGLWDVHAYCNNWDWFLWMWPIRKIKRIVKAALDYRQMEGK